MKSNQSLRILSLVGFLLLIAPFYDQCNGRGMKQAAVPVEDVAVDNIAAVIPSIDYNKSIENDNKVNDSIINETISEPAFYQKVYNLIDDEDNLNAFELAYMSEGFFEKLFTEYKELKEELSKDFKKQDYEGLFLLVRSLSFVFILLISFSLLILSLKKRIEWVRKLSLLNLFFILITLICILFFDGLFETYKQIKWGYYAFTFVQIAIFYTSKLNSETKSVSS